MAQVEKRGGLLRKSSASKKPLKEKVVLMYDEIFMTEDPSKCSPRFWEELFLMKVNLEYLEGKLESLDGEELMKIKDNINCLFQHCIQALGEEHPIRVVNALQTLCALIRGVHQKNKSTSGFDIINMLMGFDKAELCMKVRHKLQMCLWVFGLSFNKGKFEIQICIEASFPCRIKTEQLVIYIMIIHS
uniref:Armadillo like helical domain containing 3 n=1 Tax=Capra hircus TaxID=9925 RepID=A0A8C2RHT7_CAPHI